MHKVFIKTDTTITSALVHNKSCSLLMFFTQGRVTPNLLRLRWSSVHKAFLWHFHQPQQDETHNPGTKYLHLPRPTVPVSQLLGHDTAPAGAHRLRWDFCTENSSSVWADVSACLTIKLCVLEKNIYLPIASKILCSLPHVDLQARGNIWAFISRGPDGIARRGPAATSAAAWQ